MAWSLSLPGVLWSHSDGGAPANLFALDTLGNLLATVPLSGVHNLDWEDIATGRCGSRNCIYLADTGDNAEERSPVRLLRIVDTEELSEDPREVEEFRFVLPDGPRDIEAFFLLSGEEAYFITKGRNHPNTVYRYPPPLRSEEIVTLQEVQTLSEGAMQIPGQITGADATSDGRLVVVRSYEALVFYRMEDGLLVPIEGGRVELRTLNEPQGEGVGLGPDGQVVLTTEAGNFGGVPSLRMMVCGALEGG